MGYELKTKMALLEKAGAPTGKICGFNATPKTYIGTKVVHAIEMTRAAYNNLRGWQIPDNEDGNDAGYLVQYTDGGVLNVDDFTGYISWSPQDVFEKSYTVGVTKPVTLKVNHFATMPHPMLKKDAIGANAFTVIKRSEFNAGKYAPYVGDEVRIDIALEAIKQ